MSWQHTVPAIITHSVFSSLRSPYIKINQLYVSIPRIWQRAQLQIRSFNAPCIRKFHDVVEVYPLCIISPRNPFHVSQSVPDCIVHITFSMTLWQIPFFLMQWLIGTSYQIICTRPLTWLFPLSDMRSSVKNCLISQGLHSSTSVKGFHDFSIVYVWIHTTPHTFSF